MTIADRTTEERPLTVLVVDDDPGVRNLASAMLRRSGYTVIEAADGTEAEQVAIQHDGEIHVLLTDIVMPGVRGPELATRLCAVRPSTRVVYMSGFRDTEPLADVDRGDAVLGEAIPAGSSAWRNLTGSRPIRVATRTQRRVLT